MAQKDPFSVASRKPLTLSEVNEVAKIITASADPDAKIIFGVIRDESLKKGELKVTVVATGFSGQGSEVILKRMEEKRKLKNNRVFSLPYYFFSFLMLKFYF